ncbi:MAG: hypothetical protein JW741_11870 [Sedimentisphaerales bacterium]|nr:hypothetical protein [Sedimentisphaerales bacterium]
MPNPQQMLLRKFMFEGSNSEEARLLSRSLLTLSLAIALAGVASAAGPRTVVSPANAPVSVVWNVRHVISTTRHVSQGGVSLLDERWDANHKVPSGRSAVVIDDPHVKTVHLRDGYCLESAEVEGAKVEIANRKETATVRIVPTATKTVAWKVTFSR